MPLGSHQASSEPVKSLTPTRGTTVEYQAGFFNHLPIGMARIDMEGKFELVNDAMCNMLGYPRSELLAVNARSLTHPNDVQAGKLFTRQSLNRPAGQVSDGIEKRHLRKDGSILYARMSATAMRDSADEPQYWLLQLADIEETWRAKRVQEAHRGMLDQLTAGASMDRILMDVIEHSEEADPGFRAVIMLLDSDGRAFGHVIAPSMPALFRESLSGFEVGIGRASCGTAVTINQRVVVADIKTHPDWKDLQELADAVQAQSCISQPVVHSSGKVIGVFTLIGREVRQPSEHDLTYMTGMAQLVGIAIERHRSIEALRLSRARFQTMIDHAPEALLLIDFVSGRLVEANGRVKELYGVTPEELINFDPLTFAPEFQLNGRSSKEVFQERAMETKAGKPAIFNYQIRAIDGNTKHCEIRLVRLPTQSGVLIRASVIDVSLHRQVEHALRDSEENLRTTLNSIGDALIATDNLGLITHFNPVAEEITGQRRSAVIGRPVVDVIQLFDPESRKPIKGPLSYILHGDTPQIMERQALMIDEDGGERFVSKRAAKILGKRGEIKGMVLVIRDMTLWRESQERALQSRKLEAIGQLAGGIAHDFNNLLTGIMGNAEMLSTHSDLGVRSSAEMIMLAAARSAEVTGQLLRFSRNEPTIFESVNVHELIRESCKLMGHSLDKRVTIKMVLLAQNPMICGDASQLQSVFLNLALNARDAIYSHGLSAGEGLITIATSNDSDAEMVTICVSDNGAGIPPEVQSHIFEPFFTTKNVGAGTGLGLAGIYGTVKMLNGNIDVQSIPGKGASFSISFPSVMDAVVPDSSAPPTLGTGNVGRILVVDDEELVRNFLLRALHSLGYEAEGAEDGIHAEEVFKLGNFDLVLLDLVMPRRGGLETYQALAKVDPDVRVIVVSGYSRDHTVDEIVHAGARDFLRKPFPLSELATKVKDALAAKRPGC